MLDKLLSFNMPNLYNPHDIGNYDYFLYSDENFFMLFLID